MVISGHAAHDWIECKFEVIKKMSLMKGYKKMLDLSQKEDFANKLIEDPRKKGKIATIEIREEDEEYVNKKAKKSKKRRQGETTE